MKKLVYVFVAFAAISFASCGNKTANTEAAADSCAVVCDSAKVCCDSAKVCCDSAKVACDSVKCDSACVK